MIGKQINIDSKEIEDIKSVILEEMNKIIFGNYSYFIVIDRKEN